MQMITTQKYNFNSNMKQKSRLAVWGKNWDRGNNLTANTAEHPVEQEYKGHQLRLQAPKQNAKP